MGDFNVIHGFPEDYSTGHFAFIGKTGSGKTYYAKYVIKNLIDRFPFLADSLRKPGYVFCGHASVHDWNDAEADGLQLVAAANIFTTWNDEIVRQLLAELKSVKRGLLVFDDFKSAFNYHADEKFKDMFRVLRHLGAQMMVLAHSPNDIPPVARGNVDHVLLAATSNLQMMKELADNYLSGDSAAIKKAFAQLGALQNKSMLKLNTRDNTRAVHAAPPPELSGVSTSSIGTSGSDSQNQSSMQGGDFRGMEASIGMRAANVNGVYNDASHNTQLVQLNTSITAQIAQNNLNLQATRSRTELNRQLALEEVQHMAALKALQDRETLKNFLLKPYLSGEERDQAAGMLAAALGDSSVTPFTMWGGPDRAFMAAYYPTISYNKKNSSLAAVTTYTPLMAAVATNNTSSAVVEMFKAGPMLLNKGLALAGVDRKKAAEKSQGTVAREKARAMIVYRPNRGRWFTGSREKTEFMAAMRNTVRNPETITEKNVVAVSMEMLKEFYYGDYKDEMAFYLDNKNGLLKTDF